MEHEAMLPAQSPAHRPVDGMPSLHITRSIILE